MKQRRSTDDYVGFMMFDTLKAANEMKKAGITEEAAAAIVHAIYDSNKHIDISNLATKDDLSRLETSTKEDLAKLEASTKENFVRLETSFAKLETSTKEDLTKLETSTKEDFAKLETNFAKLETNFAKLENKFDAGIKDLAKEIKNLADSNVAIKATIGEIKYDILKWVIPIFLGIILAVFVKH